MKLDIVKNRENTKAYFRNPQRIDEALIFAEANRILLESDTTHIEDIPGPSEDVSVWDIGGARARIKLDFDYGAEISADSTKALDKIIAILLN